MRYLALLGLLFVSTLSVAQTRAISLEDIWQNYIFSPNGVSGFNFLQDGRSFTRLENNQVVKYDLTTGNRTGVLVDGNKLDKSRGFNGRIDSYSFSSDESKLLLSSETEQLFRRSSQAFFFVYDLASETLTPVYADKKHRLATLDPTGQRVAFVVDNNVWIRELANGNLRQVTNDGEFNKIINGAADWVYEEEFSFSRAIHWSPEGKHLAYLKFDEARVPRFTYTDFHNDLYPEYNTFKYPKVGEENSKVSLHVYTVNGSRNQELLSVNQSSDDEWHYLPRVQWTQDQDLLTAQRMNRHQNKLEMLVFDLQSGREKVILSEENKYYIDVHDNLTFLNNGEEFIWTSEKDGWNHVYLHNMKTGAEQQLTSGDWEVTNFYGLDEENDQIYFQGAMRNPMQREIYVQSTNNKAKAIPVVDLRGVNTAQFSDTYDYFVLTNSTINQPPKVTVMDREGKSVRQIIDNMVVAERIGNYGYQPAEFFDFTTEGGTTLNGYMIKPANMDENTQHPLLMFVYGGPGSQQVMDNWRGQNMAWFQMLVQRGFVVACVDNRGTGARGEEFKKMTYLQLGKYETEDQISAAKYLGAKKFIDADRIGIFGWSYGGFMASHCITQGADVFAAAIAVAPVTNWKWYDTVYTERYMRTLAENKEGYEQNSPVNYADKLKGAFLLVHGMGDDNVHFQHTAEMANALIMANKDFDSEFYPNRNHGIYGGPTRLHLYRKMTQFLMDEIGTPQKRAAGRSIRIVPSDN
ncbi:S9 family peptidase [Lewinella sp. W8]|uniref:S9 family peptidase n=1 Tax=Lewinella sp. W8 TaxID=2528208 RepID=UPI0010685440|nr:S9 family peptidase [Lewinella sp. W8]MTB51964.1 prolyl oligopeptidase family serine peptidase [Lewinella sp. W8]